MWEDSENLGSFGFNRRGAFFVVVRDAGNGGQNFGFTVLFVFALQPYDVEHSSSLRQMIKRRVRFLNGLILDFVPICLR